MTQSADAGLKRQRLPVLLASLLILVVGICIVIGNGNKGDGAKLIVRTPERVAGTSRALFPVTLNGKKGFIDRSGALVIEARFDNVYPFNHGLAAAMLNGEWGYIDEEGEWVITPRFAMVGFFSDGLAKVRLDLRGGYGYIDRKGAVVIEPQFDCADDFVGGVARVGQETLTSKLKGSLADVGIGCDYFFIDKTGERVPANVEIPLASESTAPQLESSSLEPVRINGKMGFQDQSGTIVIEPQFDYVEEFKNGLALFTVDGGERTGYIDKDGKTIWGPSK